jgi:hypothetical protein
MIRKIAQLFAGFALLTPLTLHAQNTRPPASAQTPPVNPSANTQKEKPAGPKMTDAQKITLAMSAGPDAISKDATIVDLTDMSGKQLRAGTNGWVCYADVRQPMCLDKEWQKWMTAYMTKGDLKINGTGIGYMLRGDTGASNTDPFATAPTADNQWVVAPAHIMVIYEDPKMLDSYTTDPKSGGPWVMWKGTPYAHVMVPVSPTAVASMSK